LAFPFVFFALLQGPGWNFRAFCWFSLFWFIKPFSPSNFATSGFLPLPVFQSIRAAPLYFFGHAETFARNKPLNWVWAANDHSCSIHEQNENDSKQGGETREN